MIGRFDVCFFSCLNWLEWVFLNQTRLNELLILLRKLQNFKAGILLQVLLQIVLNCSFIFTRLPDLSLQKWFYRMCDCVPRSWPQAFRSLDMQHSVNHPDCRRGAAAVQFFSMLANTESQPTRCLSGVLASPGRWGSPASWFQTAAGKSLVNTSWLLTAWRLQSRWTPLCWLCYKTIVSL